MKRSKVMATASIRLFNSLHLNLQSRTRLLHSQSQVTRYSHLSPDFSSIGSPQVYISAFTASHQKLYFSIKPNSIAELISANEWSDVIEQELEKSNPTLKHEIVLYVLKKLDNNPEKAWNFFKWVSEKHDFKPNYPLYSLMLRILGRKESMDEFWVIVKNLRDGGFHIDKETYVTLVSNFKNAKMADDADALTKLYSEMIEEDVTESTVKGVVEFVIGSDLNDEVEKKVELELSLSENTMLRILKELRGHPLKALGFFRWAAKHLGYIHNTVTYNAMLRILGSNESIEEFWNMVKDMKDADHAINIDTYTKVSRQFQNGKMIRDLVELYELMMDGPYKASDQDCSKLLRLISLTGNPDMDLVFRVVKKYEAAGYSLSKAVYDGIHRSLTSIGKFDEAEEILEKMRNAGYEPDNITYSQLVYGLCKAGRLEEASKTLDEMEAQDCVPDLKTWTILIQGHCMAGEVDKALACFTEMAGKNLDADADLLEVLVNGLCTKNKVDDAYALIIEMVEKAKLRPLQATYKLLIQRLLGEGKLKEALNLLCSMKKQNFPPFQEPFVQYIAKSGTIKDAKEFWKALSVKAHPSLSVYLNVFNSFFREGRHSEAQDLLYKCPRHIRNHSDILNLFGSTKNGTVPI
ncbi:pentatricopeptide repeat-containing protein At3g48250, chloroplastic-like [Telopea speciosissima]|uniref:pentatricopeptide repeat-containing protein At3g48250, chloroplastic-like n=1 Tax=Telopea speciosissima TaxID=54955 RepID=UPI001CC625F2|nr:pentatricopeptide repeat-containing protein At3g48250, chloroplastic-like [Telopea speciosissima]